MKLLLYVKWNNKGIAAYRPIGKPKEKFFGEWCKKDFISDLDKKGFKRDISGASEIFIFDGSVGSLFDLKSFFSTYERFFEKCTSDIKLFHINEEIIIPELNVKEKSIIADIHEDDE